MRWRNGIKDYLVHGVQNQSIRGGICSSKKAPQFIWNQIWIWKNITLFVIYDSSANCSANTVVEKRPQFKLCWEKNETLILDYEDIDFGQTVEHWTLQMTTADSYLSCSDIMLCVCERDVIVLSIIHLSFYLHFYNY